MNSRFPQYLSSPIQVLWFELDEVGLFFSCVSFALIFGGIIWFMLVIAIPVGYRKLKNNYPRGFQNNIEYLIGFKELTYYPGAFQNKYEE